MGGASPYRARFIGLPPGSRDSEGVPTDGGEKYSGLVNVANTCYVNSVVQALYFCTPFRKAAIRQLQEDKEDDAGGDTLLTSLASLFAQIECQKRPVGCLTPRHFLAKLRKANDLFCNAEHQDAHEFMQFLLNDIVETSKKRAKRQRERELEKLSSAGQAASQATPAALSSLGESPEDEQHTWLHDIFQGYLVNQMKCLCCESVSVRRETFLDLSVDIERHTSIAACLRAFESTELLRAGNKFFCDACGCLQEAEKRLRIYQLPSVLTLHLKRFKYVERLGRCCRLPYRVVFPLQLRVVEHRPSHQQGQGAVPAAGGCPDGSADVIGETSGVGPETQEQPPSRLFELRSVVVHIGRDSSRGHYVTVVRNGDRCVLLDDDVVRVVEPEVLRSFYGTPGTPTTATTRQSGGHSSDRLPGSGTWSDSSGSRFGSSDRFHHHSHGPGPLYERSPEGTCCGYLLLYEAVDGAASTADGEGGAAIDVGSAADWISEERHMDESDSGESAEERRHSNACDDNEVSQAFEQRCIPRTTSSRQQSSSSIAFSTQDGRSRDRPPAVNASPGGSGISGGRTLGSVVPAAGGAAVEMSRTGATTVSVMGSLQDTAQAR